MKTLPVEDLSYPPPGLLREGALFLDFDGTLVELADRPDDVVVPADLIALLQRLSDALGGRLAIVSGRNCRRLAEFGLSNFICAGSHGLEIVGPDGTISEPERHEALDGILSQCHSFADGKPGVVIEEKPYSVGIHYRQARQHGEAADELAEKLASDAGLYVQKGKLMAEIRPGDGNKGQAIEKVMQLSVFAARNPVFIGDDTTDEDGFEMAQQLGGEGIFVGGEGRTSAHWRLDDVMAVRTWLGDACDSLSGRPARA